MAKIATENLTGRALDWAVAQLMGQTYVPEDCYDGIGNFHPAHHYSTNWESAGPIIEKFDISIIRVDDTWGVDERGFCNNVRVPVWAATSGQNGTETSINHERHDAMFQIYEYEVIYGPTPLVAAMRVACLGLGYAIDVPDELLKEV
jgi:hypothetical protein